jgi:hypothetical protein
MRRAGAAAGLQCACSCRQAKLAIVLAKALRNELYRRVTAGEFDPRELEVTFTENHARFDHGATGSSFRLSDWGTDSWHVEAQVGTDPGSASTRNWANACAALTSWVKAIRIYQTEPDLWAESDREAAAVEIGAGTVENTPFDPEEQAEIVRQLAELKEYVRRTHELTGDQQRLLEERLDYAAEAAARLPRIDWRTAIVGALLSTLMAGLLPSDVVQEVLGAITRSLGHMYGLGQPWLPAP